jgi:hypothetical protein
MARLGVPDVDRAGRLAHLTGGISATLPPLSADDEQEREKYDLRYAGNRGPP